MGLPSAYKVRTGGVCGRVGGSLSYLLEGKRWLMCRSIRKGVRGCWPGKPMCCPARLPRHAAAAGGKWPPSLQHAHVSS